MAAKTKSQIALENEVSELKNMMMQFMKSQIAVKEVANDDKVITSNIVSQDDYIDEDEVINIPPTQLINVSSNFNGGLTLIGAHGKTIRFERFGQTMPVTFEDVQLACSNNRKFAEEGLFFIHNPKAVKLLYLTEAYEKIIDHKAIENAISLPKEKFEELYKRVTKDIKTSIIDVILKGIESNKPAYTDRNKIDFIGELYGKDLNVVVKNLKEYITK